MKSDLPTYNYCPLCGSSVSLVPMEGRDRPVCDICGKIIYINPVPAAGVIIERDGAVLLTLRSVEPKIGKWCLPGGFIEWGESPVEGATREIMEETGLAVGNLTLQDAYDSLSPLGIQVIVLVYIAGEWSGEPVAGDDAADVRWFPLDKVPPLAFSVHDRAVEEYRRSR